MKLYPFQTSVICSKKELEAREQSGQSTVISYSALGKMHIDINMDTWPIFLHTGQE